MTVDSPILGLVPSYRYFMIRPDSNGTTRVWGSFHTWANYAWDAEKRYRFPTSTVLFSGVAGHRIRCRLGRHAARTHEYAGTYERRGWQHLNRCLDIAGWQPNLDAIQRDYPDVDEAVKKFLFWHQLAQKTS